MVVIVNQCTKAQYIEQIMANLIHFTCTITFFKNGLKRIRIAFKFSLLVPPMSKTQTQWEHPKTESCWHGGKAQKKYLGGQKEAFQTVKKRPGNVTLF
jgi:hypothetical protein